MSTSSSKAGGIAKVTTLWCNSWKIDTKRLTEQKVLNIHLYGKIYFIL